MRMLVHELCRAPDGGLRVFMVSRRGSACRCIRSDDKIASLEYTMADEDSSQLLDVAAEIDVRGLQCPLPVLKAQKRLKSLENGGLLKVLATDPMAAIDFPHFCGEAGHELVVSDEVDGVLTFVIRKSHGR